jgi:hypothetical protein
MLILNAPPPLPALLKLPDFYEYFCASPSIPPYPNSSSAPPWRLWVLFKKSSETLQWYTELHNSYPLTRTFQLLSKFYIIDISIVSRRKAFTFPKVLFPVLKHFPFCPWCRRPTLFLPYTNHHAHTISKNPHFPAARCFYCGITESMVQKAL